MRRLSSLLLLCVSLAVSAAGTDDALFRTPLESFASISPDGRLLAVVVNDGTTQRIDRIDLASRERAPVFATATLGADDSAITGLQWVDNDTVVFAAVELTEGVARLSDTRHRQHILVIDMAGQTAAVRYIESSGTLIDSLPRVENEILFARTGRTSIVYRLRTDRLHKWGKTLSKTAQIDGGQFGRNNRVATVEGVALRWITDAAGTVRAVLTWQQDDGFTLQMRDTDVADWHTEHSWEPQEKNRKRRKDDDDDTRDALVYRPTALIAGSSDFVVVTNSENGRNGVYRYNYARDEKRLIYQHPSAEIVDVGLTADRTSVAWVSYFEDGLIKYHYVIGAYHEVAGQLADRFQEDSIYIAATDASERRYVLFVRSPTQPGRAFVYDRPAEELTELFSVMPWIDEAALVQSHAASVRSHELEIEYFLTLPKRESRVPLLVYPHGGPWGVLDRRLFDPAVQYLASRGMAVLQVNYRGSGGYGTEFLEKAKGEFGRRMIDDIEAATAEVLKNPAIDSDKVCAAGHSYGGYAALMLAVRSPERFACVASLAGVTDLGLLIGSYDKSTADVLLPLLTPKNLRADEHYENLKTLSPLYNAKRLNVPSYIVHGSDDRRVDIEHGHRLHDRLRKLRKPVQWREIDGMTHSFESAAAAFDYYRSLADFIDAELGSAD